MTLPLSQLRQDAIQIARAAIGAADATRLLARAISAGVPFSDSASLAVVAAGKAAAQMAECFFQRCGNRIRCGVIAAPRLPLTQPSPLRGEGKGEGIDFFAAGHPIPDEQSVQAGQRALELARSLAADEHLVVLLSGGASALMAVPASGVTLADKIQVTRALLAAGAPIEAFNTVRKHLSAVKGGQLAAACPGAIHTFAVSDVVGTAEDDASVIGSGPTVADPTTFSDALEVVRHASLGARLPPDVLDVLERGARGDRPDTPKPGDPRLARSTVHVIGGRRDAMSGAHAAADALGYHVVTCTDPVIGEARDAARQHADALREIFDQRARPACVISSGETTVRVTGQGTGGRNQEFALAAARWLHALDGPWAVLSVGTDGVDGPTDAAGAIVDSTTLSRAAATGLKPLERYLEDNDAYHFFEPLGDLITFGPTGTNVGDLQIALMG